MTAETQGHRNSKQTADELWPDSGSMPNSPEILTMAEARAQPVRAKRYDAGAIISGKYQLVEVLGEGGMGSVWVAKNRTLDVDVAIKLMRAEFADSVDGIAERMLQEARAAACIGHPAIIQVFDFGFAEYGDPFIVMELLRGESLEQALCRRHRVSPNRAVQTLLPIIDALAATHALGIVHRDLKPANIFLSRPAGQRLQPKVLDFGVAKLERRAAARMTQEGALVGSPAYMSPEQFLGTGVIDGRADIWALSVVLYETITSHLPFEGDGGGAALGWRVMNTSPKALAEQGLDEPELWKILEKGLAKDPAGRHGNMRAFGRELAEWLVSRGINEDICDASLRSWIDPVNTGVPPVHSFFPSKLPEPTEPRLLVVDPLLQEIRRSREGSGMQPIPLGQRSRHSRFSGSNRKYLWLAAATVVLAFLGATAVAVRLMAPAAPVINRHAPLREAHAKPQPSQVSSAPSVEERASVPEPAVTMEPARSMSQPKLAPSATPRPKKAVPPANKSKATRDLKNPFG
jgi:eukaryotic-like serine/threonine-protein kinase